MVAKRFNREFSSRWEQIIDFLKLHYALSQRTDTQYWQDNRDAESMPETLAENLLLWRSRAPWYYDDRRSDEMFPSASYQYVLYGMGFESTVTASQLRNNQHQRETALRFFAEAKRKRSDIASTFLLIDS